MDWGTRVSVGGGWKRPQAAPSPGGESGAAQHPRAAASPRHAEGEAQSQSTNCTPAPDSPPARGHSNRKRNSNGSPPPRAVGRGNWEGPTRRTQEGRASPRHSFEVRLRPPELAPQQCGVHDRQRLGELPVGLGAVQTRPFPPRASRRSDTSLPRSLTAPQILADSSSRGQALALNPIDRPQVEIRRHLPLTAPIDQTF